MVGVEKVNSGTESFGLPPTRKLLSKRSQRERITTNFLKTRGKDQERGNKLSTTTDSTQTHSLPFRKEEIPVRQRRAEANCTMKSFLSHLTRAKLG